MPTPKVINKNVKINLRETKCHAYRNRLIHFCNTQCKKFSCEIAIIIVNNIGTHILAHACAHIHTYIRIHE